MKEVIYQTEELIAEIGEFKYPNRFFYNKENARRHLLHILVDKYKYDMRKLYFTEDESRTYLFEMKNYSPCGNDECVGVIHYIIMEDAKE